MVMLLVGIAILFAPGYALVAMILSNLFKQWRDDPSSLKSGAWWKHPLWHQSGLYIGITILFYLLQSASQADLFSSSPYSLIATYLLTGPWITCIVTATLFILATASSINKWKVQTLLEENFQKPWRQKWTSRTYKYFIGVYLVATWGVAVSPGGISSYFANWLLASARDAGLPGIGDFSRQQITISGTMSQWSTSTRPPESQFFEIIVQILVGLTLTLAFWPVASRLSGFLTTFCKRICGRHQGQSPFDVLLRTFKEPRHYIKIRSKHPFMSNVATTLLWLAFCYSLLLALFGFSGGPLGQAISQWMDSSLASANTGMVYGATANPHLRIFLGAVVALIGMVPLAVTGCIFLPYMSARKLILNDEGVLLPDFLNGYKGMRLWEDFANIDLVKPKKDAGFARANLTVKFHSGGKITFAVKQMKKRDLEKFLSAIDEQASQCVISDAVVALRAELKQELGIEANKETKSASANQVFQSTIFVPHEPGSWLPNGEGRVVQLLASRPLSCVYLVRLESGKLAIAKQFFLAEDDEQTKALAKCFAREYELLKALNHPSISKVIDVFRKEQSTYLLLEHIDGIDLRTLTEQTGAQSEKLVLEWAIKLCDIMIYLHSFDPPVIHRDLTPDNLIVGNDGSIRIIDFGAANQFLQGITGTIIGKQCYVPPEQLRGQADKTSDIYSFGCTLNFLLTGLEPVALTPCAPGKTADISEKLDALIQQCTDFDAAKRPASFAELKTTLEEIASGAVKIKLESFQRQLEEVLLK